MTPCQLLPPFLCNQVSERLIVRQHVWVPLARVVDGAPVGVSIAELAVSGLAEPLMTIGAGAGPGVDHRVVGMGRQQLVFALPTHGLLFLK